MTALGVCAIAYLAGRYFWVPLTWFMKGEQQ